MVTSKVLNTDFEKDFMPLARQAYNFAFRLTLDQDAAKDLVQDSYIKAFRFYDSFQKGTNAKAWLFRILKNTFINDYRKKSKEPPKYDYQEIEEYYNSENASVAPDNNLKVDVIDNMMGDEMTLAFNALQEEFREIIILCDLEDFKYEEIAEILNIPIGTVRSRLHRARNALKEKIKTYAKSLGYSDEY
ncbi:MAG: sigma-70 family RNA polymerase sigma factor [Bacteroidota bacterium]|nr:sigma-70 family RNA polymerase sigma factor [Bacteroidota bacterium]